MKILIVLLFIISIGNEKAIAGSVPKIQVNAILNNAAVLTINGQQQMLRKNAISKEGYKLLKIDSDRVMLLISGEAKEIKLGALIGASKSSSNAKRKIRISRDNRGMYYSSGTINNYPVNFLIDTGATYIAINSNLANKIGIDYKSVGKSAQANTAGGTVKAWNLKLDKVSIGGVELRFVEAAVIEGDFPISPLLGMSFLSRVTMRDDGLLLTVEAKY